MYIYKNRYLKYFKHLIKICSIAYSGIIFFNHLGFYTFKQLLHLSSILF